MEFGRRAVALSRQLIHRAHAQASVPRLAVLAGGAEGQFGGTVAVLLHVHHGASFDLTTRDSELVFC
jgi:hypothetical protein